MDIAISLAVTQALIKSNLGTVMENSTATEEVGRVQYILPSVLCSLFVQIIKGSLESIEYVRLIPPNLHRLVINAFVSSIEKVFSMKPLLNSLLLIPVTKLTKL
jgi:hypothetical protein